MTYSIYFNISDEDFIVWEPILFINILSNFYLILRVRKSVLIVWFAFTSIYLKCTLFLLGINPVTIVVNGKYLNLFRMFALR